MTPVFVVDVFGTGPFTGNPAGVCVLDEPAPEYWMQAVAAEMKHSETAFLHLEDAGWRLRWFTPEREVDLCGHATVAAAHVLWETGREERRIVFTTRSGTLQCTRADGIVLEIPAEPAVKEALPPGTLKALGLVDGDVLESGVTHTGNVHIILADAKRVRSLAPDFKALRAVSNDHGFIVSAAEDDVVCRYFAPAWGIDEDPATGSIQGTLGPAWCARLGKDAIRVVQASSRSAQMHVRPLGTRVEVEGHARTVLDGRITPW